MYFKSIWVYLIPVIISFMCILNNVGEKWHPCCIDFDLKFDNFVLSYDVIVIELLLCIFIVFCNKSFDICLYWCISSTYQASCDIVWVPFIICKFKMCFQTEFCTFLSDKFHTESWIYEECLFLNPVRFSSKNFSLDWFDCSFIILLKIFY